MSEDRSTMEQLYNDSIRLINEGAIVKGKIVSLKQKEVLIDVGFKSEGVVAITEFKQDELVVGTELDFFVNSIEDDSGMISLSHEKARCMQGWDSIVQHSVTGELMDGRPTKKVKGGFIVDVMGMEGFLPATQAGAEFMVKADPTFQKWLDMVAGAAFYPTAKAEWIDVKQGVINVEQRALQGEDVKTLLDELQAQITKK